MDRELPTATRRRHAAKVWLRVALAAALALAALGWLGARLRPSLERERIRVARVERGPIEAVLTASGTVAPASERTLVSPVEARVLRVLERPGNRLEAGRPVLELDLSVPRLASGRLRESIAQAESRRRELELELAEKLIDLEGRLEVQRVEVETLLYGLEQSRELHAQGLLSEAALRRAESGLEKARIEARQLEARIAGARRSADNRARGLAAELRALESDRAELEGRLERAETRVEKPGVLTWVVEEEGALVREGQPIARLADLDRFRVEASVSDVHAGRVEEGLAVRVPIGDAVLAGRVSRVLPAVEGGALRFQVELEDGAHPALRASLRVDVLVVTERRGDALQVAKGPFASGPGEQPVLVVEGGVARRRTVRLGLSGHRRWEVLEGLEEGEEVVVSDVREVLHLEEVAIR